MNTTLPKRSLAAIRTAALALALLTAASSRAAFDAFIKFYTTDGSVVQGESTDKAFPGSDGWFSMNAFSFGIQNSITFGSATGGGGAGKASFQTFSLRKNVDSTSPAIFKMVGTGNHFKAVRLVIRKPSGTTAAPRPFLVYDFTTVFVSTQNWDGASGDDTVSESVNLEFGAMQLNYRKTNPDGTLAPYVPASWSIILNSDAFDNPASLP